MPSVPNFLSNPMTPLGQAFTNLSGALMNRPTEAEQEIQAGTLAAARAKAKGEQDQQTATSKLGQLLQNPDLYADPRLMSQPAAPDGTLQTPKFQAPPIDWGQMAATALQAGVKPEDLGGYVRFGEANARGVRDPRTTNAVVGAGAPYSNTAESFDINQANDMTKAANTNATSRANNADNVAKDVKVEGMREANSNAQADATAGNWTPQALDYAAEVYRRTGQMASIGMGKTAGQIRGQITARAAQMDQQDGKTPGDTVAGFAEFGGAKAGERTLGNREATAGMAVNELENLIPIARDKFAKVERAGVLPIDSLVQAYQHGTNDPDLAAAAVAFNDVINAHARAINPTGQVTDAGRAQSIQLLSTQQSQVGANAALDQMLVGAQAALKSPGQTRDQLHSSIAGNNGKGGNAAPAAAQHENWVRDKNGKLVKQ